MSPLLNCATLRPSHNLQDLLFTLAVSAIVVAAVVLLHLGTIFIHR